MKVLNIGVTLIVLAAFTANITLATEKPEIKAKVAMKEIASWDGTPYKSYLQGQPQLTILEITIPPHTALPWHQHPIPNAAYVVSGELTVEDRLSGKSLKVSAGQAFAESVNSSHRGVTGDEQAVVIVTYSGVEGTPLSLPDKGEKVEFEHVE
ncbi:Cupin domain-containing protein [Pseudomonas duriflava]|uniref:Cupin domain-containing protein n=1 Tax=Pseudomonas duriflava TaxID=459528 RepID=A0A562PU43_9PSED|nr:cupin domain-containing protein [Pseudomonas duriflava]TWI47972.1 Cupin domain-containing protein [Pseudomonas duriflava]